MAEGGPPPSAFSFSGISYGRRTEEAVFLGSQRKEITMKFYTLEYDCNAPTVQQLNIPTNSDYRVGVKVTLNGVEQPLKPSEVTMGGLSADEGVVNGYVTFSKSSGDEASYTQQALSVKHEPNVFLSSFTQGKSGTQFQISFRLDQTGIGSFSPDDFLVGMAQSSADYPLSTDVQTLSGVLWPPVNGTNPQMVITPEYGHEDAGPKYYAVTTQAYENLYGKPATDPALSGWYVEELPPKGTPFVARVEVGDTKFHPTTKVDVYEWSNFIRTYLKTRNNYAAAVVKISDSKPLEARLRLTENVFKSQQGDLAAVRQTGTATLAGEYADGTGFSFDVATA